MNIDRRSFELGITVACLAVPVVALIWTFIHCAWRDLKAWRIRIRLRKGNRWEPMQDHYNCRCTVVPLSDGEHATNHKDHQ